MAKKMEKAKNIMILAYYYLKENLGMTINGMENYMIKIKMILMK